MDDTTKGEPSAIIDNTDDYTDTDDDDNEEEIYRMTAIDFVVDYLLQDMAFAEHYFNRNRWDEVEQKYDIERKKLAQPAHRQPITVDMAAMRKAPKEHYQRLFPSLLRIVREHPGVTAAEANQMLGRTQYQSPSVFKCLERNPDSFVRVSERCVGGTRYRFYLKEEMVTE